jgi:hypothetical protein
MRKPSLHALKRRKAKTVVDVEEEANDRKENTLFSKHMR